MLRSAVLGQFYLDLQDPLYKTPFAIYHRRYSTNTTPKWPLAQPMRCLGHNGAPYACAIGSRCTSSESSTNQKLPCTESIWKESVVRNTVSWPPSLHATCCYLLA